MSSNQHTHNAIIHLEELLVIKVTLLEGKVAEINEKSTATNTDTIYGRFCSV